MAGKDSEPKKGPTKLEIRTWTLQASAALLSAILPQPFKQYFALALLLLVVGVLTYMAWKKQAWKTLKGRRFFRAVALLLAIPGAMYSVGALLFDARQYLLGIASLTAIAVAGAVYETVSRNAEDEEAKAMATLDAMSQLLEQTAEQENVALHQTQSTS